MIITRFKAAHLEALNLQESQEYFRSEFVNPQYGTQLEASPWAFTGVVDGRVLVCSGVHEVWAGRGVAWALISKDAGQHFFAVHRAVSGFLKQAPLRRIEAMIDAGFAPGVRWAKMLGMQQEGLMRAYSPTGVDYFIYSRIKNG